MYIDKLYYPSNGRFSINSLVSEEYAKSLRLLNREQQIKESYECFCNLVHTEFFTLKSHKSKKEKNEINKKLLTNAASKKKRMDEKLERAMEIHVKWNLKDRSSWKKDYCLKAGEGERNNLYSKLEGLYTIGENIKFWKIVWHILKRLELVYELAIPFLVYTPKRNENIHPFRCECLEQYYS